MRVLIVCRLFPLMTGTRALQMSKVVQALHEHGVDVHVISGVEKDRMSEAERCRNSGHYHLEYVPYLTPSPTSSLLARAASRAGLAKSSMKSQYIAKVAELAKKTIENHSPDVVLTVSTPVFLHRVGHEVKKEFPGLPWAAFYSDPRPLGMLPKPFRRRSPLNYFQARLNRGILRGADAALAPNKYMLDWMEENLGVSLAGRRYVVPHCGYVAADCESGATAASGWPDLRNWLLHVGSLWKGQVSPDLLKAVKNVARKYPDDFKGLMCVGKVAREVGRLVRSLEMDRYVKMVGVVSPEEAGSMVAAADVNLLADTPARVGYFLHSKFADYAVNGRPILAVIPRQCPMRDYLELLGGGIAVMHRQAEIERALEELFVDKKDRWAAEPDASGRADTELAEPFLPESVARTYLEAFERIVETKRQQSNSAPSPHLLRSPGVPRL